MDMAGIVAFRDGTFFGGMAHCHQRHRKHLFRQAELLPEKVHQLVYDAAPHGAQPKSMCCQQNVFHCSGAVVEK